ncbi:MAG: MMPL family transporter [Pseudomonadales bacterium]|nr:MMPL family transporter [Pseudomonadales bacterium]
MKNNRFISGFERLIFSYRLPLIILFALITVFMGYKATSLRMEAGFAKQLPLEHPYMKTLLKYQEDFGGGNQIIVALIQKDGTIFNPEFFTALGEATDEVFFLDGIAKSSVTSIFTPNVRFTEFIEDGFAGGNVIPAEFTPTPEWLDTVKQNIVKSGQLGRLVSYDFSGALIRAELLDFDPKTKKPLDYQRVSKDLEEKIRQRFETENVSVHILGFAKSIGDIAEGARSVIAFFGVALLITAVLLWLYSGSIKLMVLPLVCSIVAVIWQLGSLNLMGFGIDPMSILVPFLVFAIGVSHGVQMISSWMGEVLYGEDETDVHKPVMPVTSETRGVDGNEAARRTFRRLVVPGSLALVSDTIGFLTVLLIGIGIIQEMAITASIGVALIIFSNLILLPILLSYVKIKNIDQYRENRQKGESRMDNMWRALSSLTTRKKAVPVMIVMLILGSWGLYKGNDLQVGDLHSGVPELREDARYNLDTKAITQKFAIGVDVLSVIVEAPQDACINYEIMDAMDRFHWHVQNLPGVQSVASLSQAMKIVTSGNNEGSPKWQAILRNRYNMSGALRYMETSGGLMDADCTAMPILIYTADHKAQTIQTIIDGVNAFESGLPVDQFNPRLASANVGIIAATNQAVAAAQLPIMVYVYIAIFLLCVLTYRSVRGTLCIILPLALVSVLCYALMTILEIGLKVNTLPVVALGVGIGVDYGIYIYSRMDEFIAQGKTLQEAYYGALRLTGKPVIFTGLTLAAGVATWIFSDLKFQADMGILLTFMFLLNMLGAIFILPAIAHWLIKDKSEDATE